MSAVKSITLIKISARQFTIIKSEIRAALLVACCTLVIVYNGPKYTLAATQCIVRIILILCHLYCYNVTYYDVSILLVIRFKLLLTNLYVDGIIELPRWIAGRWWMIQWRRWLTHEQR